MRRVYFDFSAKVCILCVLLVLSSLWNCLCLFFFVSGNRIAKRNWIFVKSGSVRSRACLYQFLIAIRSFTLLCDRRRSKTRPITIMNLIAKLGIIYITACHASLCRTAVDCLSVSCHCCHTALTTIYKDGTGRGRWGLVSQLQQQLALWVCLKWVQAATNC